MFFYAMTARKDDVEKVKAILKDYKHKVMHLSVHATELYTEATTLKSEYKNAMKYCDDATLDLAVTELENVNKRIAKVKELALKIVNDE